METTTFDIAEFKQGKNYCIEASAGTGKTYTIKKIVAQLVKWGVPVDKILLVTYTEKAAGELRDRIQAELKELLDPSKENPSEEERRLVKKALSELDNATIGTIHSFCQKTLHDFAYEADVPFALSMASDDLLTDLIDKQIRDEWAEEIVQYNLDEKNIRDRMKNAVEKFRDGMEVDIEKNDDCKTDFNERKQKLQLLGNFADETYKAFDSKVTKDVNKAKTYSVRDLVTNIQNGSFSKKKNGSVLVSVENPELQPILEYFINEGKADKEQLKEQLLCQFILAHLEKVREGFKIQKEKNKQQSFDDMIRQVRSAVVSSDGSETPLCQKLRETYLYAIVDEFQDTNQAQWDIFQTAFLDSPHNHIIVVGDPKQSIYSFQGADLGVYLTAIQAISKKGEKNRLGTNHRSTDKMVEACNKIFSGDYFKNFEESRASGKIQPPTLNGQDLKSPVLLAQTDGKSDDAESFARYAVEKIVEFIQKDASGRTALQVFDKDSETRRDLKLSDIAALARTRTEMDAIESAMREAGIPFVRYKDSNLFKGREARQWMALLKALDAPDFSGKNRNLLRAALVSDFFRVDMGDVEDGTFENPNNPEFQKFAKWRSILKKGRYAELMESIYAETRIDKYLCDSSRLQAFAKIKQIGNYIFDYLYNNGNSLEEVVKHLEGLSLDAEDADDEDGNLVSKGSDFDAVQVMTIHASKGLQFPVVISVAGFKQPKPNEAPPYIYREEDQTKVFGLTKDAKGRHKEEILEEWRRLFYVNFTRAESVLLMPYYTKTWEKENGPFAFLKKALEPGNDDFRKYVQTEDLSAEPWMSKFAAWNDEIQELRQTVNRYLSAGAPEDGEKTSAHIVKLNREIDKKSIFQHSYSSLSGKLDRNDYSAEGTARDAEDAAEAVETIPGKGIDVRPKRIPLKESSTVSENVFGKVKNFPKGSLLGNTLHQVFENMDFEKIGGLPSSEKAVQDAEFQKLIGEQFSSQAFDAAAHPDWISQTAHFAWNTMNARMPEIHGQQATGETFSLKELSAENRLPEMEFHLNAEDGKPLHHYCKGFMDLLFRRGDYYSILDWKSDVLESYSADDAKEKVDSEYAVQRVLYSYCLVRWLQSFMKLPEEEIFQKHFGGVYYVFVRGCRAGESSGLYAQTWETFAELKNAFEQVKGLMHKERGE